LPFNALNYTERVSIDQLKKVASLSRTSEITFATDFKLRAARSIYHHFADGRTINHLGGIAVIIVNKVKGRLIELPARFMNRGGVAAIMGDALEAQDWAEFDGMGAEYALEFRNAQSEIPMEAFAGSETLRSVDAPSAEFICAMAFAGCANLESVFLPGARWIDVQAFEKCEKLRRVLIDRVEGLSADAFASCSSLERIALSRSLAEIDGNVFTGCASLESVEISGGSGLYESEDGVLYYNRGHRRVITYPAGKSGAVFECCASEVGNSAFEGCRYLEEAILPGVLRVGCDAFRGCNALRRVCLPYVRSVEACGWGDEGEDGDLLADAFCLRFLDFSGLSSCKRLEAIEIDARNPLFEKLKAVLRDQGQERLITEPRA
jgi:hypothetical protein